LIEESVANISIAGQGFVVPLKNLFMKILEKKKNLFQRKPN